MWERVSGLAKSARERTRNAWATGSEYLVNRAFVLDTLRQFRTAPTRAIHGFHAKWNALSDEQRAALKGVVETMLRAAVEASRARRLSEDAVSLPEAGVHGVEPADVTALAALERAMEESEPAPPSSATYLGLAALADTGIEPGRVLEDVAQKFHDQEQEAGRLTRSRQVDLQRVMVGARDLKRLEGSGAYDERLRALCRQFDVLSHADPGDPAPRGGDPPVDGETARKLATLEGLTADVDTSIHAAEIGAGRGANLRSVVREAEAAFRGDGEALSRARLAQLLRRLENMLVTGRGPFNDAPTSRRARLYEYVGGLMVVLLRELLDARENEDERQAIEELATRVFELRKRLEEAPDDASAIELEHEGLRPVAAEVRRFQRRRHLTVARPCWVSGHVRSDPNAISYIGGSGVAARLEPLASTRALKVLAPSAGQDPGRAAWNRLRSCAVAVFDLTEYERIEHHGDLDRAARVAATCYELGIAFALGVPVVIMADTGQEMPFDLDIEPVRLDVTGGSDLLGRAIDDALYGRQRDIAGDSVRVTMEQVVSGGRPRTADLEALATEMLDEADRDPVRAHLLLTELTRRLGQDAPEILFPTLPGSYPDAANPRCFLVTAFRPYLEATTAMVAAACGRAGISFVRGDQVLDPEILRSIWDGIGTATHVVVDLTDFNPNVAMELGMAHTLGRPVLVIGQSGVAGRLPPTLAKLRVHTYSNQGTPGNRGVDAALAAFLVAG